VERLAIGPGDTADTMARLAELHQQIRTTAGDAGSFATADLRRFHIAAARRFEAAGRLRLYRLDVGEQTIAAILCYRYGETVSFYSTGYAPEWKTYGPGRQIMARAIAGAIDEGATTFDLLRGDESHKKRWASTVCHDLRIRRPVGVRGRLLWGARSAAVALRGGAGRN
jgi:CelD/BcsL family acetyltransferase involved in cellulose biosynthesis